MATKRDKVGWGGLALALVGGGLELTPVESAFWGLLLLLLGSLVGLLAVAPWRWRWTRRITGSWYAVATRPVPAGADFLAFLPTWAAGLGIVIAPVAVTIIGTGAVISIAQRAHGPAFDVYAEYANLEDAAWDQVLAGNYNTAIDLFRSAAELARDYEHPGEAQSWCELGVLQAQVHPHGVRSDSAFVYFRTCRELAEESGDLLPQVSAWAKEGVHRHIIGQVAHGRLLLERALLEMTIRPDYRPDYTWVLRRHYSEMKWEYYGDDVDYENLQRVLAFYESNRHLLTAFARDMLPLMHASVAEAALFRGDLEGARRHLSEASDTMGREWRPARAEVLTVSAEVSLETLEVSSARLAANQALAICGDLPDVYCQARAHRVSGRIDAADGRDESAMAHWETALSLVSDSSAVAGDIYRDRGRFSLAQGDIVRGMDDLRLALRVYENRQSGPKAKALRDEIADLMVIRGG